MTASAKWPSVKCPYPFRYSIRAWRKNAFLNDSYGLGKWNINEIGVFEIKQFSKALPDKLKISTRRMIINTLHVFFNFAYKEGLVSVIPAFPTIKGNDSRPRIALNIDDQREAFNRIPDVHRDVFIFESETGCRPGETCALKIRDIDFKNKTATIRATFTMCHFRDSDKEGHKRPIPLSDVACEIARSRADQRFGEDWLFLNPKGKHYTVQNLAEIWDKYSGIDCTHYEAVRHSFCTQIAEIGDKQAAQHLMRHVDPSSTARYLHHQTEYLRDTLRKRGNVVELKKAK